MDVAGALLDRRHQHHVDEPHDRRFFALLRERFGADLFELLEDLDVFARGERLHLLEALARELECAGARRILLAGRRAVAGGRRGALAVVLGDGVGDGRFRRHDRLDVVARHELDVVHGEHVGRIGHRNRQRRAGAAERDDLVLLRGLGRNELDDREVDLELREVDRRDAVLLAEKGGDFLVLHEAHLDQVVAELPPVGLLVGQGLL